MKTLINSVFKSMKRDEGLALTEVGDLRRKFYEVTKQPMLLKNNFSVERLHRVLYEAIQNIIKDCTGYSEVYYEDLEFDVVSEKPTLMIKVRGRYTLSWRPEGANGYGYIKRGVEFETKRAMKVSTFLIKHVQDEKIAWLDEVMNTEHALHHTESHNESAKLSWKHRIAESTKATTQEHIKKIANSRNGKPCWIYFTTTDIPKHYNQLSASQCLSSCMSKSSAYYGSAYDGRQVHPLQGYEYAPDYRLGLVSFKSPEEIKECTEYPFVARVMVFPYALSNNGVGYARAYGDESVENLIGNTFKNVKKPEGLELFGMLCNSLDASDTDDVTEEIQDLYYDGECINHLVAPFIDVWNNCLHFADDGKIETRDDGKKVVRLKTGYNVSDSDDADYDTSYFSIYYGSGVLMGSRRGRNDTWALYYQDGEWEESEHIY